VQKLHKELFCSFDCVACSNCCKVIVPEISEKEIEAISKRLGIDKEEFKSKYLAKNEEGNYEICKKPCPFLNENGCSIYEFRPKNCREYPYTDKKHFTGRLINLIAQCEVCPIVFEIFERLKEHYEDEFEEFKEW
jgi:Fe-S-cluster containining protein